MPFKNLKTKFLGKNVIEFEEIDSTQLEVFRRIDKQKIESGTLIMASMQTNRETEHMEENGIQCKMII
ncbi:MAG: hypothetical protein HFJ36_00715 [Clostridia bacterium]|nr:hypothetical protein [Clostridia bacterium]